MLKSCCIKTWSSTQALVSLSSGDAELHGLVNVKAMLSALGYDILLRIFTDATVAKALAKQEAKREKKMTRKKEWDELYYR